MSDRAELLATKRRALQLRCAVERQELSYRHADVETRLSTVDRVLDVARGVAKHPLWVGAAVIGVAMVGPVKILRWLTRGAFFWSAARRLGGYFIDKK
jgi:hypothetical protein